MKKKRFALLISVVIIIAGVFGIYIFNQKKAKFNMLDYTIDEVFSSFTHDPTSGLDCKTGEVLEISLDDIMRLKAMSFQEVDLPQNAEEIFLFSDNCVNIYILRDGENYYLATNSFEMLSNDKFYTPIFDGYEHVYVSDTLLVWVDTINVSITSN